MKTLSVEQAYHAYIKTMPATEQLQIIALISKHLAHHFLESDVERRNYELWRQNESLG